MNSNIFVKRNWRISEKVYCLVYKPAASHWTYLPYIQEGEVVSISKVFDSAETPNRTTLVTVQFPDSIRRFDVTETGDIHLTKSAALSKQKQRVKKIKATLLTEIAQKEHIVQLCDSILAQE